MKVKIDMTNDTIMAVNSLLKNVYEVKEHSQEKDVKVVLSIIYDLADTFDVKVKTKIKNATLFDTKKKTKFNFKFHEAWALHEALKFLVHLSDTDYKKLLIEMLIGTLDQKLK